MKQKPKQNVETADAATIMRTAEIVLTAYFSRKATICQVATALELAVAVASSLCHAAEGKEDSPEEC